MTIPEPPGTPDPWQPPGDNVAPPPPPPPGGYPPSYPASAPQAAFGVAPRTSGRAVAVLVLGIVGLLMICGYGIGAVPAIIALALAPGTKREIAGSGGSVTGAGFVKAGVICSWITLGLSIAGIILIVAIFALGTAADTTFETDSDVVTSGVGLTGLLLGLPLLSPTLRRLHSVRPQPTKFGEEN